MGIPAGPKLEDAKTGTTITKEDEEPNREFRSLAAVQALDHFSIPFKLFAVAARDR